MTRPIIDAGPGLNFFALNQERALFDAIGAVSVPETVRDEILGKAARDKRFSHAASVMKKLPERLLEILSDDATTGLVAAVERMTHMSYPERRSISNDLGGTMVIAHAVVAASAGADIRVLIDDGQGQQIAGREAARLNRLRDRGEPVGRITLMDTVSVLRVAAGRQYIPDRSAMRKLYQRMRDIDDGLVPLDDTGLMNLDCWTPTR